MKINEIITESEELFPAVISAILKTEPSVTEIWFHGSRAIGTEHYDSDWDILALVPYSDQYIDIVHALTALNRRFENFDIQPCIDTSHIYRIATEEGQLLWSKDKSQR